VPRPPGTTAYVSRTIGAIAGRRRCSPARPGGERPDSLMQCGSSICFFTTGCSWRQVDRRVTPAADTSPLRHDVGWRRAASRRAGFTSPRLRTVSRSRSCRVSSTAIDRRQRIDKPHSRTRSSRNYLEGLRQTLCDLRIRCRSARNRKDGDPARFHVTTGALRSSHRCAERGSPSITWSLDNGPSRG
jgi:hypothetical protein